jgi:hypothetical protein
MKTKPNKEQQERIDKAIDILESAYISGNGVRMEYHNGTAVIINHDCIPFFRDALAKKEFGK